jgi:filamentous hemagglutinin
VIVAGILFYVTAIVGGVISLVESRILAGSGRRRLPPDDVPFEDEVEPNPSEGKAPNTIAASAGSFLDENGILVNADQAVINPSKLTDYALNPDHPVGGNKAVVFDSSLGFNQSSADDFLAQLKQGVTKNPGTPGVVDQFGSRFTVDIPVTGQNGNKAVVRTGFIYTPGSNVPNLTTLFVK